MLGLFGGAFNPIHLGHLALAKTAYQTLNLNQIMLIPCGIPVQKSVLFFSNEQRLNLIDIAIKDKDYLQVDKREISNNHKNYTVDTLQNIKAENSHETLCFIMGMDSFANIQTWQDWQQLTDYAHLIVASRPNYQPNSTLRKQFKITTNSNDLHQHSAGFVYLLEGVNYNIASSEIITCLQRDEDITPFVGNTLANAIRINLKQA